MGFFFSSSETKFCVAIYLVKINCNTIYPDKPTHSWVVFEYWKHKFQMNELGQGPSVILSFCQEVLAEGACVWRTGVATRSDIDSSACVNNVKKPGRTFGALFQGRRAA